MSGRGVFVQYREMISRYFIVRVPREFAGGFGMLRFIPACSCIPLLLQAYGWFVFHCATIGARIEKRQMGSGNIGDEAGIRLPIVAARRKLMGIAFSGVERPEQRGAQRDCVNGASYQDCGAKGRVQQ